jgi:predicted Fe-S protein YdhL (DUF1289 family)
MVTEHRVVQAWAAVQDEQREAVLGPAEVNIEVRLVHREKRHARIMRLDE